VTFVTLLTTKPEEPFLVVVVKPRVLIKEVFFTPVPFLSSSISLQPNILGGMA